MQSADAARVLPHEGRLDLLAEPVETRSVLYRLACASLVAGPVFAGSRSDGSGQRELLPRSDVVASPARLCDTYSSAQPCGVEVFDFFRHVKKAMHPMVLLYSIKKDGSASGSVLVHGASSRLRGDAVCACNIPQFLRLFPLATVGQRIRCIKPDQWWRGSSESCGQASSQQAGLSHEYRLLQVQVPGSEVAEWVARVSAYGTTCLPITTTFSLTHAFSVSIYAHKTLWIMTARAHSFYIERLKQESICMSFIWKAR